MPEKDVAKKTASGLAREYSSAIKGKTILVTGVSPGGIGAAFVLALAPMQPSMFILLGRNAERTEQTARAIQELSPHTHIRTRVVDLGCLASVRAAADAILAWSDVPRIDVLVNNAGTCGGPRAITDEGFENLFASNYLGPFLLTNLLMPKILASDAPRVVNAGSDGHILSPIRFDDPNFRDEDVYNTWIAYGQSKTANMLMAISLASKYGDQHNLRAFSVHPGAVTTNLASHLDLSLLYTEMTRTYRMLGHGQGWKSDFDFQIPDEGAATYVYVAFDPNLSSYNGGYFLQCRLAEPSRDDLRAWATSPVEAEMLWDLSQKLVKKYME